MPRFDPTEFGRMLARLSPHELRQAEGLVADARKRAEAVLKIDALADSGGPSAACPRCGSDTRIRWGRTSLLEAVANVAVGHGVAFMRTVATLLRAERRWLDGSI